MFLDRKRFWIYSGSKVIGYSNLEKGDPSMGVSFGVFIPSKDYPSVENEVREAFAKNDFKNLALSAKQIRNGKIIDCVFISFTPPPVELPNEPIEITVGGIPHPEYSVLFPR
jgi:hypothetical protein